MMRVGTSEMDLQRSLLTASPPAHGRKPDAGLRHRMPCEGQASYCLCPIVAYNDGVGRVAVYLIATFQ
jgi:hypothetical protein